MNFRHHWQGETIATTMSFTTGLLPPLFWAVRLGRGRPVCTRCFLALGAIEPLSEIAHRGLKSFHFPLQSRFTLHKPSMLGAPVVRFPLELDIGLLCRHHRLLGEGVVCVVLSGAKAEVEINCGWVCFMRDVIPDCSEKYRGVLKGGMG